MTVREAGRKRWRGISKAKRSRIMRELARKRQAKMTLADRQELGRLGSAARHGGTAGSQA